MKSLDNGDWARTALFLDTFSGQPGSLSLISLWSYHHDNFKLQQQMLIGREVALCGHGVMV